MATQTPLQISYMDRSTTGEFVEKYGERYYAIHNVDRMPPFFVSMVSHDNHWLFASSNGGLTAGRVSPDTALFPYVTVDKIHDSVGNTGCLTLLRVERNGESVEWRPFDPQRHPKSPVARTMYKSVAGNSICFEETHLELGLTFGYRWRYSSQFGFVRDCELESLSDRHYRVAMIDGLRNLLPAGTPRFAQTNTSNLVDAYKWNELQRGSLLGCFTLYSAITDRAEPAESLRSNTVFALGLESPGILLSETQIDLFRDGQMPQTEWHTRGQRGCYLVSTSFELSARENKHWRFVAEVEQDQATVSQLHQQLQSDPSLSQQIDSDINNGTDALLRLMASADALQDTAENFVSVHHYANVLFNVLRGGVFDDHYAIASSDFERSLSRFDCNLTAQLRDWLSKLPDTMTRGSLLDAVMTHGDPQLERLCREYLPIRFGRRHGDPSRPWNQFAIELYEDDGERLLAYQGNWRDIFQNWEALAVSYPDFIESIIAKFVNASTADGYNPYRITSAGIDWEVEEPDDPWSYIGYWGDHQIIYLQKLLELSVQFHPGRLASLLTRPVFCYANVPYRLRSFEQMLADPKNTIDYDETLAEDIERRVDERGADGKLLLADDGSVYRVSLIEKLLVPLLAKLSNLVVDGGIWMNTQRPEWNDANNALVGQGASMVTMNYLRRYVVFLQSLLDHTTQCTLSAEVSEWLAETEAALRHIATSLDGKTPVTDEQRAVMLMQLGKPACRFRAELYRQEGFSGSRSIEIEEVHALLKHALTTIDHCIRTSRRTDRMYHAYNALEFRDGEIGVRHLYPMLEGQVAVLSSQSIDAAETIEILDGLFASAVYRDDQKSFMLYPDRALPGFLERNVLAADSVMQIGLLRRLLETCNSNLVVADSSGSFRFHADLANAAVLETRLSEIASEYPDLVAADRDAVHGLYEKTFDHQSFTGRSGTMFGFEGLGSIYWHMVAKLLLAVQERFFDALDSAADEALIDALGERYYQVRDGLGFNKDPVEYGAFPADPYSHTPGHAGAQQPGMTGQVKEEILTRLGELGIRLKDGALRITPHLLRAQEFHANAGEFRFLNHASEWQSLVRPAQSLAFTWCQVPFVFTRADSATPRVKMTLADDSVVEQESLELTVEHTNLITGRHGAVRAVHVTLPTDRLFGNH
ncbi:MAG: hypothetical protein AAGL69_03100 [Pseudomonadota bacterium]